MQRTAIWKLASLSAFVLCRAAWADASQAPDLAASGIAAAKSISAAATSGTAVTSSSGNYVNDCFKVGALAKALSSDLVVDKQYFVLAQTADANPTLTLIKAVPRFPTCAPDLNAELAATLTASALIASGATRIGYTYGALTMPYKYYPKTRSFSSTAPIGAYLGLRRGQVGSGTTYAMAITLSSVKANTLDPKTLVAGKPSVTGTTDVAALSIAAGVMLDIAKSTTGKPFKAGLFVGVDRVNQSSTVSFPENGKAWVAIQLGYDFTDN